MIVFFFFCFSFFFFLLLSFSICFFFQAEDGIRYLVRSRGLGDVYKRQDVHAVRYSAAFPITKDGNDLLLDDQAQPFHVYFPTEEYSGLKFLINADFYLEDCLLYTSEAADERSSVDFGGRRFIKKKKEKKREERNKKKKEI